MRFVQIQIMRRWKLLGFGQNASEIHVLLFPNFMGIPFDYPIISWVTNYVRNSRFLTCLSWFLSHLAIKDSTLLLQSLELKYNFISEFSRLFDKTPLRIYLNVLFRVCRFSK